MKLVLIKRTSGRIKDSKPKISVSSKGSFYVNSKAMKLMGIGEEGANVFVFQEKEDQQKWYIHLSDEGYVKLKPKNLAKDGSGQMHVTDIALKVRNSFYHVGKNSLKFVLGEAKQIDGKAYYPMEIIKDSIEMEIPNPNGPAK